MGDWQKGAVMTLMKHRESPRLEAFDRVFGQWPEFFRRPVLMWPGDADDMLKVEEYQENGTRVIRAEIAGIDPDTDVEITVSDGMLHISGLMILTRASTSQSTIAPTAIPRRPASTDHAGASCSW